jgi:predicted O-methyltransferase YrrM
LDTKKLEIYIEELITERAEIFQEMEEHARAFGVPIMQLVAIETMLQTLRIQNPKTILEVGTAIGYSALRMAFALPFATIVTIERDEQRLKEAVRFIEKAERQEQIITIEGDALAVEEQVKRYAPFDTIFLDAAKGQYRRFFEMYSPYLRDNGLIITDNVLFKGLVCEEMIDNKRLRPLVKKIREFNQWLMAHPDYDTAIIPVGDGVAISKKR